MSKFTDASLVVVPSLHKAGKLYAVKPGTGLADFAVTRSTVKWVLGPNGVLRSVPANTPALEYNTDRTFRGMLVEPAATNTIRNNTMVGAVVGTIGSGGALPTNWTLNSRGLTTEVLSLSTESGVEYIEIRFSGTASQSLPVDVNIETTTQIVASLGQTWCHSAWIKTVAAPNPPTSLRLKISELTSLGAYLTEGTTIIPQVNTWVRYQTVRTTVNASVARVTPVVHANVTSGQSYDFTIRIGLPQMEQSAVATSVMKTSGSTVNRTADSIVRTSAASLIGQTSGTMYLELEKRLSNATSIAFQVGDGVSTNQSDIRFDTSNRPLGFVNAGGSTVCSITGTAVSANTIYKYGFAYALNDFALYQNGVSVGTDNVGANFATSVSRIDIGQNFNGLFQLNGWIRSAALFPERFPNAELATLTTL